MAAIVAGCAAHGVPSTPSAVSGIRTALQSNDANAFHYKAVALPNGFVPQSITRSGIVVGASGDRAAIYENGKLTLLAKYAPCQYAIATAANARGETVGYCVQGTQPGLYYALYYKNGAVSVLRPYPKQSRNWIVPLTINDLGQIMGYAGNTHVQDTAPLLTYFHSDGRPATITKYASGPIAVLNSSGTFAFTYEANENQNISYAATGHGETISEIYPSDTANGVTDMNDSESVVGWVHGFMNYAFLYSKAGGFSVLPHPAGSNQMIATGINKTGLAIGEACGNTCEIFAYNGLLVNLLPFIVPQRSYNLMTNVNQVGFFPGLADSGAFVATVSLQNSSAYYLIEPTAK